MSIDKHQATGTLSSAAVRDDVPRILCVDDEPNVLSALKRLLRPEGYEVSLANGGREALGLLSERPVDLVISDMRMPEMDGAEFLSKVRHDWPDIMRILLTGYADVQSAIAAINTGEVYRYLPKPWNESELLSAVRHALERQALQREKNRLELLTQAQNHELTEINATLEKKVQERTHEISQASSKLRKNYLASIKTFTELLEWRGGPLAGHSRRVADLARRTARVLSLTENEQHEVFIAAMIHDVGHMSLPDKVLSLPVSKFLPEEAVRYQKHPILAEHAFLAIDELHAVAELVRAHHERYDGAGFPDGLSGSAIPMGARIIAVADAYDDMQIGHLSAPKLTPADARVMIAHGRGNQFDPEVVDAFLQMLLDAAPVDESPPREITTASLEVGMLLARDLFSSEGVVLLPVGQKLDETLIARIRVREERDGTRLSIWVQASR